MNIHSETIAIGDSPPNLGTEPIPARYYYDADWYELERRAIFLRSWINVGHVCELPEPGSFFRRDLEFANASLLIVRGKDGAVRAFHNVCTHRGTQLVEEASGRKSTFSCRYHLWTFGTDGALVSAPDFERFATTKDACALREVPLDICAGLIFVCFEPHEPLRAFLGDMAGMLEQLPVARATTFHEYVWEVEANWKLAYDNFQENYHLRFIHRNTAGAGIGQDNPFGYPTHFSFHGRHRTQGIWTNPQPELTPSQLVGFSRGMPRLAADGLLGSSLAREYMAIFPASFLLCTPGTHFLHTLYPLGPQRSRGVIRLYWVGADETPGVRFAREYTLAATRDVHSEDVDIIEAGQRGIASGALEHIHFQEKEVLCRHLMKNVEQMVETYREEAAQR